MRQGILCTLKHDKAITVVGEVNQGSDVLDLARQVNPHIIIFDLEIKADNSMAIVESLRRDLPKTPLIILSPYSSGFYPYYFKRLAVAGYLCKSDAADEVLNAIHAMGQNETYFSKTVAEKEAANSENESSIFHRLSTQELMIFLYLIHGMRYEAVVTLLRVKEDTVLSYRRKIIKKLGLSTPVEWLHAAKRDKLFLTPNLD